MALVGKLLELDHFVEHGADAVLEDLQTVVEVGELLVGAFERGGGDVLLVAVLLAVVFLRLGVGVV